MAKNNKENIREINIKIDGEEWKNANDKAFRERQKTVKVDGFRKGKVPRSIYEKHYGKESLYLDAANELVDAAYEKAVKEIEFDLVARPNVDIKEINEDGVEFTFKFIGKPTVNIKKYKGLKVKPDKVKVEDEDIENELKGLLERYTELVSIEKGKVKEGNIAVIDYEGFKDGEAFEGGKGENYSLEIGSHTFIPGFEEALVGMKVGEEKDINLTFPEDYGHADLAGADVVFKVKVNDIKEKKIPELNEDFFDDLGLDGIDSEEKLREEIKSSLQKEREFRAEDKYLNELLEEIGKNTEVDIPEEMVEEETNYLLEELENSLKQRGFTTDLYCKFSNITKEDLKADMEKRAFNNVLYRLVIEELMNLEKIEITEEEMEEELKKIAEEHKTTVEELKKELVKDEEHLKADLKSRKLVELLKEYNK